MEEWHLLELHFFLCEMKEYVFFLETSKLIKEVQVKCAATSLLYKEKRGADILINSLLIVGNVKDFETFSNTLSYIGERICELMHVCTLHAKKQAGLNTLPLMIINMFHIPRLFEYVM